MQHTDAQQLQNIKSQIAEMESFLISAAKMGRFSVYPEQITVRVYGSLKWEEWQPSEHWAHKQKRINGCGTWEICFSIILLLH